MNPRVRKIPRPVRILPVVLLTILGSSAAVDVASAGEPEPSSAEQVELVLDLSGSMKANDAGGQTRLSAAKQAVTRIIDTAPAQARLGLRVYGATYPGEDKARGCGDTQQVLPVAAMDAAARADAKRRVAGLDALGFTPVGVALRAAAQDVATDGPRRIVLVSDGEDTCAPPEPCEVARELKAQGVELAVDTVGFKTDEAARRQLACIADATGGSYVDADNAEALTANLDTLFRRTWRTYQATGVPVRGVSDGCGNAPLVAPGQYLDAMPGGKDLYYRVKKTPEQLLQVSATVVAEGAYGRGAGITVSAGIPGDGEPDQWLVQYEDAPGWSNVITAGSRSTPQSGALRAPDDIGCVKVTNQVTRQGEPSLPVELLIGIADPVRGGAVPQPPPRSGADAEGGFSFNSATPVGTGSYRQTIAVGEAPFWRVDLSAGQELRVTAGVDIPESFPGDTPTGWSVKIFNAARNPVTCNSEDPSLAVLFSGQTGHFEHTCGPWRIVGPQTDDAGFDPVSMMPGTYYIQVQVAEPAEKAQGLIVPISLQVDVTGTPLSGNHDPVFVFGESGGGNGTAGGAVSGGGTGGPTDAAPGTESGDETVFTAGGIALGVGLVMVVLVGAYLLRRHRRG